MLLSIRPEAQYWEFRINRSLAIAFAISLLFHVLLLLFVLPEVLKPLTPGSEPEKRNIEVRLQAPQSRASAPVPAQPLPPLPEPVRPKPQPQKPRPAPKQLQSPAPPQPTMPKPPVAAAQAPSSIVQVPAAPSQRPALDNLKLPPPKVPEIPEPTDMASYVAAQKQKRMLAEGYTQRDIDEIKARDLPPLTEEQKRDAIIKRNLQQQGSNGLFQITSLSQYSAHFLFRGWKHDGSPTRRESISIEVGVGEDIQRAVIKRMIAIIRQHEQGDFQWESPRMNRTITLSARPEDNAGLEDFLLKEIFPAGPITVPAYGR